MAVTFFFGLIVHDALTSTNYSLFVRCYILPSNIVLAALTSASAVYLDHIGICHKHGLIASSAVQQMQLVVWSAFERTISSE